MNANELADELQELDSKLHLIDLFKAATMLRQQQAEIEALKPYKEKIEAMERSYQRHFEAALAADNIWKRATGKAQEK